VSDWVEGDGAWHREYRTAWDDKTRVGADGHSRLQAECWTAVEAACAAAGFPVPKPDRVDSGEGGSYLTGVMPDGRVFCLFRDGAEIGTSRFELWDFRSPEDLCEAFAAALARIPEDAATPVPADGDAPREAESTRMLVLAQGAHLTIRPDDDESDSWLKRHATRLQEGLPGMGGGLLRSVRSRVGALRPGRRTPEN
jgi:hypothetical protein